MDIKIDAEDKIEAETVISNTISTDSQNTLAVSEINIDILPVIYNIIRCLEKDPLDNSNKHRESHECSQKILELQKRFESARSQISRLYGVDYNKEEQLQKLELLRNQLLLKQKLIRKYKANNEQLIQRMADSYPMRRAAQLVVSLMYKAKSIGNDHQFQNMTPERFKQFMEVFRSNIKKEIDDVKNEIKKRKL